MGSGVICDIPALWLANAQFKVSGLGRGERVLWNISVFFKAALRLCQVRLSRAADVPMPSGVAAPQHHGGADSEGSECSRVHMQSGERVEFSQNRRRKNRFSSWICKSKAFKVWEASGSLGWMHGKWALERNRGTLFCSGGSLGPDREGGGNWLQRRVHNFCEGVEENRVHYLDVSGLIPENGNKDKKVHVSIYCFVLLCVLMWPEAK